MNIDLHNFNTLLQNILSSSGQTRQNLEKYLFSFSNTDFASYINLSFQSLKNQNQDIRIFDLLQLLKVLREKMGLKSIEIQNILEIQQELFFLISNEMIQQVRNIFIEVIAETGCYLLKNAAPKISNVFISKVWALISPNNIDLTICAAKLFAKIFENSIESILNSLNEIIIFVGNGFKSEIRPLQLSCCALLGKFVEYAEYKYCIKFEIFTRQMVEMLYMWLIQNQREGEELLVIFSEISVSEPKFFKNNFLNILEISIELHKNVNISNYAKKNLIEIIISLAERIPKSLPLQQNILEQIFQIIFYHFLSINYEIDKTWEFPDEEEIDKKEVLDNDYEIITFARECFDRLISATNATPILPLLCNSLFNLLSLSDWRNQNAAFMLFSQLGEYLEYPEEIQKIINKSLEFINNENSMVRYSVYHCLGQLALDANDLWNSVLIAKIVPLICSGMQEKIPKVVGHAAAALSNLIEVMTTKDRNLYLNLICENIFSAIENSSVYVKIECLICLNRLILSGKELLLPYLNNISILIYQLIRTFANTKYRSLRGKAIICISNLSIYINDQESFQMILPIIELLVTNANIFSYKDYLECWKNLCSNNKDFLGILFDKFYPQLFQKINDYFNSIIDQKNEHQTIDNEDLEGVKLTIDFINNILKNFHPYMMNYLENITVFLTEKFKFGLSESCNQYISTSFINLIRCMKNSFKNKTLIHKQYTKGFIDILIKSLHNSNFDEISNEEEQIRALNDIIIEISEVFLDHEEIELINDLIIKIFLRNFQNICKKELSLKSETIDEDEIDLLISEISENIKLLMTLCSLIGSLLKTHKHLNKSLIKRLLNDIVPNYIDKSRQNELNYFSVSAIDDILEFIDSSFFEEQKQFIFNYLISHTKNNSIKIVQACFYGIGIYVEKIETTEIMVEQIKNEVIAKLKIPSKNNFALGFMRDNIVSCFGKLIRFQNDKLQEWETLINLWLAELPLKYDENEAIKQHDFLLNVLNNNPNVFLKQNEILIEKIFTVLSDIYKTKFSNPTIDENIMFFINHLRKSGSFFYENFIKFMSRKNRVESRENQSLFRDLELRNIQ